ncbi:MAG: RNA-binding protein [Iphinoe sp. HA4291-MV1]|jgi:RNA recognition motif-containing protein|nr:RNA-binding protein [Iphinoe sp. HA4291-MV1]
MFKVSGLPIQITKSDLDELFSSYGEIQITKNSIIIKVEKDDSFAFVQLDKNEERAIRELDRTRWRGSILHLDPIRGEGPLLGQPGSGGTGSEDTGSKNILHLDPVRGDGIVFGQVGSGGTRSGL